MAPYIYDKTHNLQIFNKNGFFETRSINITIADFSENLQIKLRDASDFVFNYTAKIDLRLFETMRSEQALDINFHEFKTNLIDMLHQVQKLEMFLKCDLDCNNCKLVFYGKSKIKSIIFLIIDFQITNQKEIFDEMHSNIMELQNINKNLAAQLQLTKNVINEKNYEIERFQTINKQLEKRFLEDLQKLDGIFSKKLQECSNKLITRILQLSQKVLKLIQDVDVVKAESLLKSDSSARLLQSMENLRLESLETSKIINELKRENCTLKTSQFNNEKYIEELKIALQQHENDYLELQKQRDEFEKDVKQATMIIAQKTAANEELAKDVVQANQMLVNFNYLFDTKNNEIDELKNLLANNEKLFHEQNSKYQELCKEFHDYKMKFNIEERNKLTQELFAANKRVEEMEKQCRDTTKLNELLTRKLASGDFPRKQYH